MTDVKTELRDEIIEAVGEFEPDLIGVSFLRDELTQAIADRILAIPEIAEALQISAGFTGDYRDYLLRRGRWAGVSKDAGYA